MATISLRVYNREIEGLIESGKLDQAIAHCQHILKTYSMHIGTYQLLGKAYLEAHRYADATDIFQRILNAAPDDFIAHVGMSIIRDDEGKLNDSIWHMERAYEVQPSNPAIQGELRRLYGKRDGIEPAKIRLSREALANMYAQGELYSQAIAEIRAILTDDPERPDLQVMLTKAYFQTGQKVEAAEMAAHLLKKYPYCVDALRVLVEVLPGSVNTENIQVYQQRLKLLDPYSPYATESAFQTDQIPDDSVVLEKLEYLPEVQSRPGQAAWANNLGINLDKINPEEAPPKAEETPDAAGLASEVAIAEQPTVEVEPTATVTGENADEIAKADLPEWLKSQVSSDINISQDDVVNAPKDENALPEWLTNLNEEETPETIPSLEKSSEEIPDIPEQTEDVIKHSMDEPLSVDFISEEIPETSKPNETSKEGFDSWFSELAGGAEGDKDGKTKSEAFTQPTPALAVPSSDETIPEIPISLISPALSAETVPVIADINDTSSNVDRQTDEASTEKVINDEIPDWIHSLAVNSESKTREQPGTGSIPGAVQEAPSEPHTKEEEIFENIPDWLREINKDQLQVEDNQENLEKKIHTVLEENNQPANPEEETQKVIVKTEGKESSPITPTVPEEDTSITAWLKRLDESTPAKTELEKAPEQDIVVNKEEDLPLWLRNLEKDKGIESVLSEPVYAPSEMETQQGIAQNMVANKGIPGQPVEEEGKKQDFTEDENLPKKKATPTVPDEWIPESSQMERTPSGDTSLRETEDFKENQEQNLVVKTPITEPLETGTSAVNKDSLSLSLAEEFLQENKLNEAAKEYLKLIKKGKFVQEITEQLKIAVEKKPDNSFLWQTLGDAYMRNNKLQDALDAYSKAELYLR